MTATRPLRAGLIGALLGGIGPLLLSCAAVAGSPSAGPASAVGIAVPIGTAVVVAGPADSVWVFAVVVAVSGAVTCGYAGAVGERLGLLVAVLLGLTAGLVPTAVLAA